MLESKDLRRNRAAGLVREEREMLAGAAGEALGSIMAYKR